MNRILASFSSIALLAVAASAQCFEPNLGILAPDALNPAGYGDDALFDLQPMNFAFPMGGVAASYTHAEIGTNGVIFLTNGALSAATTTGYSTSVTTQLTNLRGLAGQPPRIAPLWRDLNNLAVNGGGVFFNNTIPGKFVVTWKNTVQFGSTTPVFSLQVQLFATGEIQFWYSTNAASSAATITGVSQGNLIAAVPGVDLSVGGNTGTTKLMFQQFPAATLDLGGRNLSFLPNVGGGYDQSASSCVPAAHSNYGTGCYNISDSFYQTFATAALASPALSGTAITLTPAGSGKVVTNGGALLPVGSIQPVPTIVAVGDDVSQVVPFTTGSFPGSTGLSICSNGFVSLATGNGSGFTASAPVMLSDPQTSFRSWHDMNPTIVGSGQVNYEESASAIMVTWDGVWDFGGTSVADASTIQIQLYPSGVVVIAWGALSTLGASGIGYVVGYSPGGPSLDGGSINLATALPITVTNNIPAMSMSASPAPVSTGVSGTLVTYTMSNIPEAAPTSGVYVGITIVSLTPNPLGTDLTFLGMPGCSLWVGSLDVTMGFAGGTSTLTTQLQIPAGVAAGTLVFATSAALIVPNSLPNGQNAFGAVTSGGVSSFISGF